MLDDGTISITFDGYKGKEFSERVSMYVLGDGSSGFLIKDIKNKTRVRFNLDKEMNSNFEILDSKEQAKIKGTVSSDGKTKFIK